MKRPASMPRALPKSGPLCLIIPKRDVVTLKHIADGGNMADIRSAIRALLDAPMCLQPISRDFHE